jgi:hypothetical protein
MGAHIRDAGAYLPDRWPSRMRLTGMPQAIRVAPVTGIVGNHTGWEVTVLILAVVRPAGAGLAVALWRRRHVAAPPSWAEGSCGPSGPSSLPTFGCMVLWEEHGDQEWPPVTAAISGAARTAGRPGGA